MIESQSFLDLSYFCSVIMLADKFLLKSFCGRGVINYILSMSKAELF